MPENRIDALASTEKPDTSTRPMSRERHIQLMQEAPQRRAELVRQLSESPVFQAVFRKYDHLARR
ncbi:MAG: hypothetical protein JWQ72_3276 [Polaromonas sp.]|nr:hypothetical protein [Polaromonas sp.]